MARPRTFDDDTALDAAVACFWRLGLDRTSIRDLTDEMGIKGPSLYNAFGDKRTLFVRSLERYAETTARERLQRLEAEPSARSSLQTFFDEIIGRSLDDRERRGCLIINSALEVAPHDPEIGRLIAGYLSEIETFFRGRITAGQKCGEIATSQTAPDLARLLLGVLVAIRVLARTGATRAQLEGMARPALAMLDNPAGQPEK